MALTGLLILASGFFLVSIAVLPEVSHRIRGIRSAGVYYGWWVLAACCLLALFTGGIFYRGFTVFFLPIQREFNLSRASTALIFSLATAEGGIGGPIVGWLIDRLGSRPLILVGGLLAGIGFIALSFVNGYFSFLIVYVGIVSVGISTGLDPSLMTAVNRWFLRRKAIALATMLTSYTLGGALLTPLLALGVQRIGWRDVVLIAGGFICLIVIPLGDAGPPVAGKRRTGVGRYRGPATVCRSGRQCGHARVRPRLSRPGGGADPHLLDAPCGQRPADWGQQLHRGAPDTDDGLEGHGRNVGGRPDGPAFLSVHPRQALCQAPMADRFPVQPILFGGMMSGSLSMLVLAGFEGSWVPYLFIVGLAGPGGLLTPRLDCLGQLFRTPELCHPAGHYERLLQPGNAAFPGLRRVGIRRHRQLRDCGRILCLALRPSAPPSSPQSANRACPHHPHENRPFSFFTRGPEEPCVIPAT